jgi:hypothetical protein
MHAPPCIPEPSDEVSLAADDKAKRACCISQMSADYEDVFEQDSNSVPALRSKGRCVCGSVSVAAAGLRSTIPDESGPQLDFP